MPAFDAAYFEKYANAASYGAAAVPRAAYNRVIKQAMIMACNRWRLIYLKDRFTPLFAATAGYRQTPNQVFRKARQIYGKEIIAREFNGWNFFHGDRIPEGNPQWLRWLKIEREHKGLPKRGGWRKYWKELRRDFRRWARKRFRFELEKYYPRMRPLITTGKMNKLVFTGKITAGAHGKNGVYGYVPLPDSGAKHRKVGMVLKRVPAFERESHATWFQEYFQVLLAVEVAKANAKQARLDQRAANAETRAYKRIIARDNRAKREAEKNARGNGTAPPRRPRTSIPRMVA